MEFNKRKLKLLIDGQGYEITYPSVDQLMEHQVDHDKAKGSAGQSLVAVKKFLSELGLPKNISGGLEVSALTKIINEVSGVEKK